MLAIVHVFLFLVYGGLAAAVAVMLPAWIPAVRDLEALLAGGLLFLCAALLHEQLTRLARQGGLLERLGAQRRRLAELEDELSWTRRELKVVRDVLEEVARQGPAAQEGRINEVMAELHVLKTLVARLGEAEAPSQEGEAVASAGPAPLTIRPLREEPAAVREDERLAQVREALRNDRVELVLQPIVTLPQRKQCSFECYSRLVTAGGARLLPEQYLEIAESAGLITAIDNMLLFRCVQLIRKMHRQSRDVGFFCNISAHTIADEAFFTDFVEFLEGNEDLAGHLVFEFAQADFARWSGVGARLLDRLALLGCRFSLDQVEDLDLDPALLSERRVRFIKVEAGLLLEELGRDAGLVRALRRRHIDLIAEKVEDENRLIELLEYDVDFGPGFLLGEPRPAKPVN